MSSTAVWRYSGIIVVGLLVMPLVAKALARRPFSGGMVAVYLVVLLAMLLMGLFLISTSLVYLILPLGMIIAANEAMLVLAFATGARVASSRELPFTPTFALFMLASGCIWMACVGIAANNLGAADFAGLMAVATVCIVAIAVLYIAFLLATIRRFAPAALKQAPPPATKNPQSEAPAAKRPCAAPARATCTQPGPDRDGNATLENPRAVEADDPSLREAGRNLSLETWLAQFDLTLREREVARCIIDGLAFRAIANALGISERTAKFHATSIYKKMGFSSRNELSAAWTAYVSEENPPTSASPTSTGSER